MSAGQSPAGPTDHPSGGGLPADPIAAVAALPGLDVAVARARAAVDELLAHRVLRRRSAEVSAEAVLRGAWASAALEGERVQLDELRRALREGVPLGDRTPPTVRGAVRLSAEIGPLAGTFSRSPLQALARWHLAAASGVVPDDELGRPRDGAGALLRPLVSAVTAQTTAPALVVAAVAHGELLSLAPFGWGNGLVARAAARALLIERGLDPKAVTVPEAGHLELGVEAYGHALDSYREGTPAGVGAWVAHCAEALALGAREGLAIATALERG